MEKQKYFDLNVESIKSLEIKEVKISTSVESEIVLSI